MKKKPEKPQFTKLAHVGVVVYDIEKVVKRLKSLNIGPIGPVPFPPIIGNPLFRDKPTDMEVKGLMASIGDIELELIQPVKGESPYKEFLEKRGGRYSSYCLFNK